MTSDRPAEVKGQPLGSISKTIFLQRQTETEHFLQLRYNTAKGQPDTSDLSKLLVVDI